MIKSMMGLLGASLFLTSALQAQTIRCTIRDNSQSPSSEGVSTEPLLTKVDVRYSKSVSLRDGKHQIEMAIYIGQVQIYLKDANTRETLSSVNTSDRDFSILNFWVKKPDVYVSCRGSASTNENVSPID